MITQQCNLSCPHCPIRGTFDDFDYAKFMYELNRFEGEIIMFGGEPTVHQNRMFDVIEDNRRNGKSKIGSISTNLLELNPRLLSWYKEIGYIATSWNPKRFNDVEYSKWLWNLKSLAENGLKAAVLITLTPDLIYPGVNLFTSVVSAWPADATSHIKFEHYVGPENTPEYYEDADRWLCELYKKWDSPIRVETFDKSIKWYFDCSGTYTLMPNGILVHTCPNGLYSPKLVLDECLTCPRAFECMPCRLQQGCPYPKNLRKLIESEV